MKNARKYVINMFSFLFFQPLKFHTAKITARKRRLYRYKELNP